VYKIKTSNRFEKDFVKCAKRNFNLELLGKALEFLESSGSLPRKYKPHVLSGNFSGYWECHIKPDWLLIWKVNEETRIIELVRTGTHADLF
jgi:mRNA interferase YafQ